MVIRLVFFYSGYLFHIVLHSPFFNIDKYYSLYF